MSSNKQGTVYTDGKGASPGGQGGFGVHLGQGHPHNASGPVRGSNVSGERAEFRAASAGLTQATKAGYSHVNVVTDSHTVAHAGKTGHYSGPNQDLHQSMQSKAASMGSVNYQHVKGHSGNPGNQAAHNLAKSGSKK